jgi:hypothetical protein
LALCQRYFYRYNSPGNAEGVTVAMKYTNNQAYGSVRFPVPMRATPSFTTSGADTWDYLFATSGASTNLNGTTQISKEFVGLAFPVSASITNGDAVQLRPTGGSPWFAVDAEL